jgi:hypothetical protein
MNTLDQISPTQTEAQVDGAAVIACRWRAQVFRKSESLERDKPEREAWRNSGGPGAQRNREKRPAKTHHRPAETGLGIGSHSRAQNIAGLALDQMGEIRKKMGFLFQHAALYDSLTVEQNVAFPSPAP